MEGNFDDEMKPCHYCPYELGRYRRDDVSLDYEKVKIINERYKEGRIDSTGKIEFSKSTKQNDKTIWKILVV